MGKKVIESFRGKFRVVLMFGAPGSGKGTQAKFLADAGGHVHVSSGDVFRGLSKESGAGKVFLEYAERGRLVPDSVTVEVWHNYVMGLIATNRYFPGSQLLILDGIPRTEVQVELVNRYVEVERVIVLDAKDPRVFIDRLKRRAVIEKRFDDTDDEVLKTRMDVYKRETAGLLKLFGKKAISHFDATQKPAQVLRDILVDLADAL